MGSGKWEWEVGSGKWEVGSGNKVFFRVRSQDIDFRSLPRYIRENF